MNSPDLAVKGLPTLDELAGGWQPVTEFMCMPSVTSKFGSLKVDHDLLSISHLAFPPITVGGDQSDELWWSEDDETTPADDAIPEALLEHMRASDIARLWSSAGSIGRVRV